MNFFKVNFFDRFYCWLHGHSPVATFRYTRVRNGHTQEKFRYQCLVCGKTLPKRNQPAAEHVAEKVKEAKL